MSTFTGQSPSGTINGINMIFTLGAVLPTSVEVYLNGVLMTPTDDYTLTTTTATATISFSPTSVPQPGDALTAWLFTQ